MEDLGMEKYLIELSWSVSACGLGAKGMWMSLEEEKAEILSRGGKT